MPEGSFPQGHSRSDHNKLLIYFLLIPFAKQIPAPLFSITKSDTLFLYPFTYRTDKHAVIYYI